MDLNQCTFVGKVKGQPNIHSDNNASFTFTVKDRYPDESGQWKDHFYDVTVFTNQAGLVKTIGGYLKPGHEIAITTAYMQWQGQDGQVKHGFRLIGPISLGWAPREEQAQDNPPI